MKRVKKMVAMATVMTMVFNVVMPIGVLAKENTIWGTCKKRSKFFRKRTDNWRYCN